MDELEVEFGMFADIECHNPGALAAYKLGLTPVGSRAFEALPPRLRQPHDQPQILLRLHFGEPNSTELRCAKLTPTAALELAALELAARLHELATDLIDEESTALRRRTG